LALRLDGWMLAVVDALRRRPVGRLADEDPVHRRRGLEPRRGVDDVARGHAFAGVWPRGEVDERLARVDRDANLQLALHRDPVANRKSGAHGTLRIVLTR